MSNGIRLVSSVAQLEQYLEFHGEYQRRRATTRARLDAIGSAALVTDVAAGLFASRGLDPLATLAALRAARAQGDHGGIVIRTDTTRERLTLVEGIVEVAFDFEGGDYASGKLTLNGEYPKTLAMAAKGRAMAAFVDHPAFRAAGVTVRQARALRGRLRLYHRVQLGPIEEAAAAWGSQSHAVATTVATGPG